MKSEIFSQFDQTQTIYLSTFDGKYPRVRPVTLICNDDEFFIATGSEDAKVAQLRDRNEIEFCYSLKKDDTGGYIRGAGATEFVTDNGTRKRVFDIIPFLKQFFKTAEDEGFCLIRVILKEIEYMKPGEHLATKYKI
ncbi:MAG: pyridoxamine 5'-phosphate oxidase family protein [Candidatus Delongbacteria bacterium]|nr:pyridoxamine 5'-phosphate oxidase family protein [Candidatus Delongbacteria bacterium]